MEFIHVYGTLGQLCELHDTQTSHNYGDQVTRESISVAAGGIHIMGRHEQRREIFQQARLVIQEAEFIGVLGYGFDPINNENLGLSEALRDKYPFITGYGMGCGSRARFAGWGFGNRDLGVLMGGKSEGVRDFLAETDFLRWINEPSASAHHASQLITTVFRDSILPYAR